MELTYTVNPDRKIKFKDSDYLSYGTVLKDSKLLKMFFRNSFIGLANGFFPDVYEFFFSHSKAKILASRSATGWTIGTDNHENDTQNFLDILFGETNQP